MKELVARGLLVAGGIAFMVVYALGLRDSLKENPAELRVLALPAGARDVAELGNGWHTFTLSIDGRKRTFLRHHEDGFGGSESTVELSPVAGRDSQ